jgi:hypothetical protein
MPGTPGTLIIAVYQMGNKELVWEGSGSDMVSTMSRGPEQNQQYINDAVQKKPEEFPLRRNRLISQLVP